MGDSVKDITCGSVAGILGKFVEYPFDTIKVRLQSQPISPTRLYSGPLDCFRKSLSKDGYRSLYRGISAPLLSAAVENSSLFFSYQLTQQLLSSSGIYTQNGSSDRLPISALVLCGAISGAFTSLLLTPIELIKCKMQVPSPAVRPPTISSLIRQIYLQHGVIGFWHGQLGTLIRETGGGAAWFGTYEYATLLFRRFNSTGSIFATSTVPRDDDHSLKAEKIPLTILQQLTAGACAGMTYNFLFYPADTIKSRMQTESLAISGKAPATPAIPKVRRTFRHEIQLLYRQQGIRGFYTGCGITVARSAPSSALIFAVFEWLRGGFDRVWPVKGLELGEMEGMRGKEWDREVLRVDSGAS